MADFTGDHLQSLILEPSTMKSNMQIIDDMISYNFIDHHHHHQQQQPQNFINTEIQSSFNPNAAAAAAVAPPPVVHFNHESKKEKRQWQSSGGVRKRKKDNERGEGLEKPGEVIHVRVKRGQATDSHSLAERVRRQKINERLKSLQNLVPGCYKTMGMAVMLEVITQYIQSLQNQIEFLSMKLSAASMVYESNSVEMNAMEGLQGANAYEAHEMDRTTATEEYGGLSYFHPTWPS